jgi:hypothetical protein
MAERKTVSFGGTCAARSTAVLVSKRIMRPFALREIHVHFPLGCQNLVTLAFYASPDDEAPSTGGPTGVSLLADYGQVDWVRGDGVSKVMAHTVRFEAAGVWLKVYAANVDYYEHDIDVEMEIDVE